MSQVLSEEQLLLINNLLYLSDNPPLHEMKAGQTIGELLRSVDPTQLDPSKEYTFFTTGKEWSNIISAVKSDPQVSNLMISQSHTDAHYGGTSFLLTSPDKSEAIVAFRGTATAEWKDNFTGGGPTSLPDQVSTECQKNALEWYQSLDLDSYQNITVTGHSKGGNKSQYIAILDNSVDRCVSFDGQGFSDEFYEKYADQIAHNKNKIVNCSAESDYVNFLLNSVGEQKYFKGHDYGSDAAFAENHAPNTMMTFDENGKPVMIPSSQSEDIENLDKFLNSYLRAADKKENALALVGDLVQSIQNKGSTQDFINILADGSHQEDVAFLLAYIFAYRDEYPEIADSIKRVLNGLGMKDADSIIDLLIDLQDNNVLDNLAQGLGQFAQFGLVQGAAIGFINDKYGLELTDEQYQNICNMVVKAGDKLNSIQVSPNSGADRSLLSPAFYIDIDFVRSAADQLAEVADRTKTLAQEIDAVTGTLSGTLILVKPFIKLRANQINTASGNLSKYSSSLETIIEKYSSAESENKAALTSRIIRV